MKRLALFGGRKTRQKPFTPFPVIDKEEARIVSEVIKTNRLSGFIAAPGESFLGGPYVKKLEEMIRDYFNVRFAITVNSATAGLHCALAALDLKSDDEVIVPPYTMSATPTAVLMAGATPVFADVSDDDFCIDPAKIEKLITKNTKAIMVVHLFGCPAKMDQIKRLASKHRLAVIEDCAQAPGAKYKGRLVGTIGDAGIFSFNQHKTITTGEGGFIITNDEKLALKMQLIRNHGEAIVEGMGLDDSFAHIFGYNYRMTELEAAVGIGQFPKLDKLNAHRIKLAEYLKKGLSKFKGLSFHKSDNGTKEVYFLLAMKIDDKKLGISRDQLVDALNAEGIPFGKGYVKPLYLLPVFQKNKNKKHRYATGICPVTERLHKKILMNSSPALLRYPMDQKDMDDVIAAFEKILSNKHEFKTL